MLKGEFVVYLHIMNYVSGIIQILSCNLQMKNETKLLILLLELLKKMRIVEIQKTV